MPALTILDQIRLLRRRAYAHALALNGLADSCTAPLAYAVVFLVSLSGATSSDAGTLTPKLRMAQESREQCTDRCDSGYDACIRKCPRGVGHTSCVADCKAQ